MTAADINAPALRLGMPERFLDFFFGMRSARQLMFSV
jgi:hypothetical protein